MAEFSETKLKSIYEDDALESLANKVYALLAQQILTGALRPGQWISENEIAKQIGVSRSPVREALRTLAREGIVEVLPRRGTMVAEFTAADVEGLYQARELIDPEMAGLAAAGMGPADRVELEAIKEALEGAEGNLDVFYRGTEQLWLVMANCCQNRTIADVSLMLLRRSGRVRGIALAIPETQLAMVRFATTMVESAAAADHDRAKAAMATLLRSKRELLLDRLFLQVGGGREISRVAP